MLDLDTSNPLLIGIAINQAVQPVGSHAFWMTNSPLLHKVGPPGYKLVNKGAI